MKHDLYLFFHLVEQGYLALNIIYSVHDIIVMKGTVSEVIHLGPRYYFMKCSKNCLDVAQFSA